MPKVLWDLKSEVPNTSRFWRIASKDSLGKVSVEGILKGENKLAS